MSESQTGAGNQECFEKLSLSQLSLSHSLTLDILNNVCFHVYAQKSLIIGENSENSKSERVGVTFEHRHENKSCSACRE